MDVRGSLGAYFFLFDKYKQCRIRFLLALIIAMAMVLS